MVRRDASPQILHHALESLAEALSEHGLQLVIRHAEFVQPEKFTDAVCRDSDDDKFLECAAAAAAEAIVSGDKDLLTLSAFRSIPILSPRQFIDAHLTD